MSDKDLQVVKQGETKFISPDHPSLTKLYANGFNVGTSVADMYLIGTLNGSPSFVLNLSCTTAKHLRDALDKLVIDYEKDTGTVIPSVQDLVEGFKKAGKI